MTLPVACEGNNINEVVYKPQHIRNCHAVNAKHPDGHRGHLTKEQRATKTPGSETVWLGVVPLAKTAKEFGDETLPITFGHNEFHNNTGSSSSPFHTDLMLANVYQLTQGNAYHVADGNDSNHGLRYDGAVDGAYHFGYGGVALGVGGKREGEVNCSWFRFRRHSDHADRHCSCNNK